jgi:hypothetical protein
MMVSKASEPQMRDVMNACNKKGKLYDQRRRLLSLGKEGPANGNQG